jgi:hypothetical protein
VCAIYCEYGNVLDVHGCPTCQCNPAPTCAPTNCPNLNCANGVMKDAKGCATCTCQTGCPAGTHAVSCPGVRCNIACADGFARDASGCDTCSCRAPASCAPPNVLCVACAFGYRTGPNGCRTCACDDPPEGCALN